MSLPPADHESTLRDLNELVVNCPALTKLEGLLGNFNIFQVLRSERNELRHSNVLAWLFNPSESHGLGETFLRKWLMQVLHHAPGGGAFGMRPVDIDGWKLLDVKVYREWENIDILILLTLAKGEKWVVCIENKVDAVQRYGQLDGYRKVVESRFPTATCKLFFFLTKNLEEPADPAFIRTSYERVRDSLAESLSQQRTSIGNDPRVLIEHYIRLIEEKFMDQSEIARTALQIYKNHKRALDVLFHYRAENVWAMIIAKVTQSLKEHAERLGIVPVTSSGFIVRFIPKDWDQAGNKHGNLWIWRPFQGNILFEIDFNADVPKFLIVSGEAPQPWLASLHEICEQAPFSAIKGFTDIRHPAYPAHHAEEIPVSLAIDAIEDPDETAKALFAWIETRLATESVRQMVSVIAAELPALDAHHRSQAS